MKDYKCVTQRVSNVVDDGYKINVFTSAEFKVFSPHLTCILKLESLNLRNPKSSDKYSTYTIKDKQVWLKSLYQRYLKAEPSHHLKAISVSPFAFNSINRQKNNLIALIKALKPCLLVLSLVLGK